MMNVVKNHAAPTKWAKTIIREKQHDLAHLVDQYYFFPFKVYFMIIIVIIIYLFIYHLFF
jgi:hypothetical protein